MNVRLFQGIGGEIDQGEQVPEAAGRFIHSIVHQGEHTGRFRQIDNLITVLADQPMDQPLPAIIVQGLGKIVFQRDAHHYNGSAETVPEAGHGRRDIPSVVAIQVGNDPAGGIGNLHLHHDPVGGGKHMGTWHIAAVIFFDKFIPDHFSCSQIPLQHFVSSSTVYRLPDRNTQICAISPAAEDFCRSSVQKEQFFGQVFPYNSILAVFCLCSVPEYKIGVCCDPGNAEHAESVCPIGHPNRTTDMIPERIIAQFRSLHQALFCRFVQCIHPGPFSAEHFPVSRFFVGIVQQLLCLEGGTVKSGGIGSSHHGFHFPAGSEESGVRKRIGFMVENKIFRDVLLFADRRKQISRNAGGSHAVVADAVKPGEWSMIRACQSLADGQCTVTVQICTAGLHISDGYFRRIHIHSPPDFFCQSHQRILCQLPPSAQQGKTFRGILTA